MMKHIRGPGIRKKKQPVKPALRDSLGLFREMLDAILKTVAVFLPLPAIQIYVYLRMIDHTDLFSPAVLSTAGLSAILLASAIMLMAFLGCIAGPSIIIPGCILGVRPSKGLMKLIMVNAILWSLFYGTMLGFSGYLYPGAGFWWTFNTLAGVIIIFLLGLAWKSPKWMMVVPHDPMGASIAGRGGAPAWIACSDTILWVWNMLCRPRFWHCVVIVSILSFAGIYSGVSIWAVYFFKDAYSMPDSGFWVAVFAICIVILSFTPGILYLWLRAFGHTHGRSLTFTSISIGAVLFFLSANGTLEAPALVAMKTVGIIDSAPGVKDTSPKSYEILKPDEYSTYQKLGFTGKLKKSTARFVYATTGFQLLDAQLMCAQPLKFPEDWFSRWRKGNLRIDTAGCLRVTKDEIRVVDWPRGKPWQVDAPVQASTPVVANTQKSATGQSQNLTLGNPARHQR